MVFILLVDDNVQKIDDVRRIIDDLFLQGTVHLEIAGCVSVAAAALRKQYFDLVILDLSIPMREGENPLQDGGIHLLNLLQGNGRANFRVPGHILGLTEFDDLAARHANVFTVGSWLIIKYERNSTAWCQRLSDKILHIVAARFVADSSFQTDLAIITALEAIELESILKLNASWSAAALEGDSTIYHHGVFARGEKRVRVVAAAASEMGMPATASLATKMIFLFRPKYIGIAGIAAGVKGVGNYGDILVADSAFDLGSGKQNILNGVPQFLPAPYPIPLDPGMKARMSLLSQQADVLDAIRQSWQGERPERLKLHIGPFASGAAVISDEQIVQNILGINRKLIGLDMEAYGLFTASRLVSNPKPTAFAAKSICDFADSQKADSFQRYAGYTSAQIIYELALRYL